jgi:AbiV family abortive infection protein
MSETASTKYPTGNTDLKIRQACLDYACDLLASASLVFRDNGFPNIAYHLAVLALEEIGKAGMIAARAVSAGMRDIAWMDKKFNDHVWKLQWAVWSRGFADGRIDPKDFEAARRFATSTHARRMAGLYAQTDSPGPEPRSRVTVGHASSIVNLARTRLELEMAAGPPVLDDANDDLEWFLNTMSDGLGAKRLLSGPYIGKHEELKGNTRAWVAWARQEFEKISAEEQAYLQAELARLPSNPQSRKPKWVIKIRLHTPSHSIRPKVLSYWNSRMNWIKLTAVNSKKNELLLELTLHDALPVKGLYDTGSPSAKCSSHA